MKNDGERAIPPMSKDMGILACLYLEKSPIDSPFGFMLARIQAHH